MVEEDLNQIEESQTIEHVPIVGNKRGKNQEDIHKQDE